MRTIALPTVFSPSRQCPHLRTQSVRSGTCDGCPFTATWQTHQTSNAITPVTVLELSAVEVRGSRVGNNLPLSEKMRSIFRRSCTLRTGPCPMKSRSNLESFEIVRISAGSVTTTMSVIPGKYVRFMLNSSGIGVIVTRLSLLCQCCCFEAMQQILRDANGLSPIPLGSV
jgi:hypothetical protein